MSFILSLSLSLLLLLGNVNSDKLLIEREIHIFTTETTVCNEEPHQHAWFYGSACSKWRQHIRRYYHHNIDCTVDKVTQSDGIVHEQSKCIPTMDNMMYDVNVIYTIKKNNEKSGGYCKNDCEASQEYELLVDARMAYTNHPGTQLFMLIFTIYIGYCLTRIEHDDFNQLIWYAFMYGCTGTCTNILYYIYNSDIANPYIHMALDPNMLDNGYRRVITG